MAKAKVKEIEVLTIPEGMKASDLSQEKRIEIFQSVFDKAKEGWANDFGLALDVEIVFNPKGVVPRLVVVDLLQKKDEQKNPTQAPKQAAKE